MSPFVGLLRERRSTSRYFPSRDQSPATGGRSVVNTVVSSPEPSAGFTWTSIIDFLLSRWKAIFVPSGDQTAPSAPSPKVKRVRTARSSKIQTEGDPVAASLIPAAMRFPSGEIESVEYSTGSPKGSPMGLPERSSHVSLVSSDPEAPSTYTRTPESDAANAPRKYGGSYCTPSATGTASPIVFLEEGSKRCASRIRSRMKRR